MKILGIETSSYCGSVAVTDDDLVLCEYLVNTGPKHSEKLMLMVEQVLGDAGMERDEIDAISVSTGPGSFTSLRVGLSIAKGMAYSLGLRISGISSLDTLAASLAESGFYLCPVIDAKRGEVYSKLYEGSMFGEIIFDEQILSVESMCEKIGGKTVFIGEGAKLYRGVIENKLGENACFAPDPLDLPRASFMCGISHRNLVSGKEDNVFGLTPNYIRRSDAEEKLKK